MGIMSGILRDNALVVSEFELRLAFFLVFVLKIGEKGSPPVTVNSKNTVKWR
jgi:hypothetical protein